MTLERGLWIATVTVLLVSGLVLLLSGYLGYAAVVTAVAASAAVNLR